MSRQLGGEVQTFYAILGSQHDTMFIVNAPNDEKMDDSIVFNGKRMRECVCPRARASRGHREDPGEAQAAATARSLWTHPHTPSRISAK
jgi:hypothetical protein